MPLDLDNYKVSSVRELYYIPDYISEAEHDSLVREITSSRTKWTQVKGRRLQYFGGQVREQTSSLIHVPLPRWLDALCQRLCEDTGIFEGSPNHVLLNAYSPGEGIQSHQDGPIYHPGVCILSLGAPAVMHFYEKLPDGGISQQSAASVVLLPRSLLVFCDEAYTEHLHRIDSVPVDVMHDGIANLAAARLAPRDSLLRGERFSLTVRRVLKVRKNLLRL